MATELSIINTALAHLGEERQLSDLALDPAPREQRVAQALLPQATETMLRKHPWLCAERRLTVTRIPLPGPADWKFANVFLLPPTTLRLWLADTSEPYQMGPYVEMNPDMTEKSRRKALFSNASGPLNITIIDLIGYEHFDASLSGALSFDLASLMAGPLQADKALAQKLDGKAEAALADAMTIQTSELTEDPAPRGRWLSGR